MDDLEYCGRTFCAEEFAGDVELFAADDDNFLTVQQLLSYCTGQATKQMSFAIDHDLERVRSMISLEFYV